MPRSRLFHSPSASARLDAARAHVDALADGGDLLIVGATRAAADELAATVAMARGRSGR